MSAEATRQAEKADTDKPRPTAEERVERIASYWGSACADAWRTVFPPGTIRGWFRRTSSTEEQT